MARVLIVEADRPLGQIIKKYLESRNHKVRWRPEPQSAINTADKWRPDVVVTDLILGRHNGVEFLYEFRSYPEWLTIPIIIYSSVPSQKLTGSELALFDLTVNDYLYKANASVADLEESIIAHSRPVLS